MNQLPQGLLGYAPVTANQTGITTAVDITNATTTVTVVAGRRLRISAEVGWFSSVADDVGRLTIMQDGAAIQTRSWPQRPAGWGITAMASVVIQPSAGSHIYKLQFARDTGTGTITIQAGATNPTYILVEDIGT